MKIPFYPQHFISIKFFVVSIFNFDPNKKQNKYPVFIFQSLISSEVEYFFILTLCSNLPIHTCYLFFDCGIYLIDL